MQEKHQIVRIKRKVTAFLSDEEFYRLSARGLLHEELCPHRTLKTFIKYPQNSPARERHYTRHVEEQERYLSLLSSGNPSQSLKKQFLLTKSQRIGMLYVENEDGTKTYFPANAKGTMRYGKKMAAKIRDNVSLAMDMEWQSFFLTLTCDPSAFDNDRARAWCEYKSKIGCLTEYLRKQKGAKWVKIYESTKKNFPHVHIVLFFPSGTFENYEKLPCKKRIKFGELVDIIKERYAFKVFDLRKLYGDGAAYYVSKYIAKTENSSIFRLAQKKEDWTKDEEKEADVYLSTWAAGIRQIEISNNIVKEWEKKNSVKYEEYKAQIMRQSKAEKDERQEKDKRKYAPIEARGNIGEEYHNSIGKWEKEDGIRFCPFIQKLIAGAERRDDKLREAVGEDNFWEMVSELYSRCVFHDERRHVKTAPREELERFLVDLRTQYAFLITLSINSPSPCARYMAYMPRGRFESINGENCGESGTIEESKWSRTRYSGEKISCGGCIYTEVERFLANPLNDCYNYRVDPHDDASPRVFDSVGYFPSVEFLLKLGDMISMLEDILIRKKISLYAWIHDPVARYLAQEEYGTGLW